MKPTLRVLLAGPLLLPVSAAAQQATNLSSNVSNPSIQFVLDDPATADGDVIELSAGTYTESVIVEHDITIRGVGGVTWTADDDTRIIELTGNVAFTLDGVTVSSTASNRQAINATASGNDITIRNATFDTASSTNGGALIAIDPVSVEISDTLFRGDGASRATDGGAIHVTSSIVVPVDLTDVTFDQVVASSDGGGIFARGVDLTCTRCTFDGTDAGVGGAIFAADGQLTVSESLFCGSTATVGGAIHGDAGGTVRASRFVEGVALSGGAIFADGGSWTVTNNHFLGLEGTGAVEGTGVGTTLELTNNLFLDNDEYGIAQVFGASATVTYNWFDGNGEAPQFGATPDATNLTNDGDPDLVSWSRNGNCDDDDLSPVPLVSGLIDAGDPAITDPDSSISDIGAYGGPEADPAYHVDNDSDGATFLHDCDDDDPDSFPGNPEVCDLVDNDCNGEVDDDPEDIDTFYPDCDGDGEGTTNGAFTQCFEPAPLGCGGDWVAASVGGPTAGLDCDDTNPLVNTSADESCADGDQNCDNDDDFGATDGPTYFLDGDDDTFGGIAEPSCDTLPPSGYVVNGGDCNDGNDTIYPGAADTCGDYVDSDCNGGDGDDASILPWYPDTDQDGYGEITSTPTVDCNDLGATGAYTGADLALDCDDTRDDVSPAAVEVCNGIDDDCNSVPDDVVGTSTWYEDQDQDLYGNTAAPVESACPPDAQWTAQGGDCNDSDAAIHPGADESCNGIDDDCDGDLDAEDDGAVDVTLVWEDWDADGYGACDDGDDACLPFAVCEKDLTDNHAPNADDCNDADAAQNPSRQEVPGNAIDENCDGIIPGDDGGTDGGGEDPGCKCTTSPQPGAMAFLGLLLLVIRRRRH